MSTSKLLTKIRYAFTWTRLGKKTRALNDKLVFEESGTTMRGADQELSLPKGVVARTCPLGAKCKVPVTWCINCNDACLDGSDVPKPSQTNCLRGEILERRRFDYYDLEFRWRPCCSSYPSPHSIGGEAMRGRQLPITNMPFMVSHAVGASTTATASVPTIPNLSCWKCIPEGGERAACARERFNLTGSVK